MLSGHPYSWHTQGPPVWQERGSHPGLYPSGLVFPFAGSEPHCKIRNQFIPMNHAQASCTQAEKASRAGSLGNPRKYSVTSL